MRRLEGEKDKEQDGWMNRMIPAGLDDCLDEMRFARHGYEFHGVKMNRMGSLAGTEVGSSMSVLPHATAYRLWGALELASRLGSSCELILIGSPNGDTRAMEELAQVLMPKRKIVSKTHLGGTSEHPKNVESFVGKRPFILVTSAMHMKRAMRCFELQGLKPVPYPVDFLSGGEYRWTDFLPNVDNLWKLNIVLREYLALGVVQR